MELQASVQAAKKDNLDKQAKNRKIECSVKQFNAKI
jgi:hypothetical protein